MKVDQKTLLRIVAETLDVPLADLDGESASDDFQQWDSLAHLRICMAVEESFGVAVEMEKIPLLDSIPRLEAYLRGR